MKSKDSSETSNDQSRDMNLQINHIQIITLRQKRVKMKTDANECKAYSVFLFLQYPKQDN